MPLWRRVVLTSLVGAILITSVPNEAYAGTPQYDPVFYYYHPDHLGSCQLMTDRNGELVQQYGYTPFGEENYRNNTSAFEVSSRYTGQTLDEDTGLYYYGARYYDPELARFIQADSTVPDPEFSQAYNRYAYVYNNPLKFTDPTGQNPFLIAVFMGAYIGGFQGAHHGGISGLLKGALLGGVTAALSFGVGMMGSLIGGPIAGAVTGFAASYALRGTISGDWHFTAMDALNLGIAVFAAYLEDPRPGAERTLGDANTEAQQRSSGDTGAGGITVEKQDVIVFVNENIQSMGMGSGSNLSQKQAMKIAEGIVGEGGKGNIYKFETPDEIAAQLKTLELNRAKKAVEVYVIAHGNAGEVHYNIAGLQFKTTDWQNIARYLYGKSRIHLISCRVAAGEKGLDALTRWSKATGVMFSAYDVKLRYTWWRNPHFKMLGDGHLYIAYPSRQGGVKVGPRPEKYFWQLYKK